MYSTDFAKYKCDSTKVFSTVYMYIFFIMSHISDPKK